MKQYYYLEGKEQKGPFTIEEIKTKGLTKETLVWTDDMENWQKIKDIPELLESLSEKKVPPPPPPLLTETKVEIIDNKSKKPSKKILIILIIWCSFHLFALLMSYSNIEYLSGGSQRTDKLWPFVEFRDCTPIIEWTKTYDTIAYNKRIRKIEQDKEVQKMIKDWNKENRKSKLVLDLSLIYPALPNEIHEWRTKIGEKCNFNGIFYEYDWSEFALYVGGALIAFLLYRIIAKKEPEK